MNSLTQKLISMGNLFTLAVVLTAAVAVGCSDKKPETPAGMSIADSQAQADKARAQGVAEADKREAAYRQGVEYGQVHPAVTATVTASPVPQAT